MTTKLKPGVSWNWAGVFYTGSLAVIALAGAVVRFWDLGRQSLWQDEIHTALYVRDFPALWEVVRRVAVWDLHAPFYYVLLWAEVWVERFIHLPLSEGNLRLLSAVLGTLALPGIYFLFRQVFANRWWAWGALFFASFNMYALYYSQELRMYAAILAITPWVLLSQLTLWNAQGALNKKMAAVYTVGSVLLLYSSLVCAFFVVGTWTALMVMVWFERKTYPRKTPQVLGLGALMVLGYLPWIGVMWRQSMALKSGVWTGMVISQPRELLKFAFENLWLHCWKLGGAFAMVSKAARLLMPLALLNLWETNNRKRHGLLLLGFALTFLIYFSLTWQKPFHTGRYFSPWWPWAIYFLVAAFSGLMAALRKIRFPWPRVAAVLALVFGGLYLGVQIRNAEFYFSGFEKENYRSAVENLNAVPDRTLAVLVANTWQKACLEYYGAKFRILMPWELNQLKGTGGLEVVYVGVQPPQMEKELAGMNLQVELQNWGIKSLNRYHVYPPLTQAP